VVSLADVLLAVESKGRVCPQPRKWHELYQLLPHKTATRPAVPLILGGWWHSTPTQKQQRLREHLDWAAAHGALDVVWDFLNTLQETDWVHQDEAPSGELHLDSDEEQE
jgi:DNA-directed RNA polymerase